jgi:hypothetical protein
MKSIRVTLAVAVLAMTLPMGCGGSADKPAPDASKVEPFPDSALQSAGSNDSVK